MPSPRSLSEESIRSVIAWGIGPCLPGWALILVLYGLERLSAMEAMAAAAVFFVLMAIFVFTRLADLVRLIRYTELLLKNIDAPAPPIHTSATVQRLRNALTALQKLWADRRDEAEGLATSRQVIIDSLPEPLLLLDRKRRVVGANAAARDLLDREAGATGSTRELLYRDLAWVIRDPKVLEATDRALAQNKGGEALLSFPAPIERTFRTLLVSLGLVEKDGTALIMVLQEQTEHLKMDQMRADFVANASHELRTPLAIVLGFIETLRGAARDDTEAREKFLEIMLKQANRMTRLIDDLLSLSRIELREHMRPTGETDIATVLSATVDLLDVQKRERKTSIRINVATDLPHVIGEPTVLSQVFYNLTNNALKYGGESGSVEISAQRVEERPLSMPGTGPCVRIAVRDHGGGIPKEHIPRLTERFYRVDTARSREMGGTGLGLAIVKHITLQHRGVLAIESEIGKGSTFSVYLPMVGTTS